MNRSVTPSDRRIEPESLPPPRREPGGPARVLFLHGLEVGFATTAGNLEHYAGLRPDLDAVHIRLVMPRWLRLFCKQSPAPVGELDYRYLRHMLGWRMYLRTLLGPGRPLDPARFDAVHIMTQQRALIALDRPRDAPPHRPKFVVNIDATLRGWEAMRGTRRLAPPVDWAVERRILRGADALACATRWAADSAADRYGVRRDRMILHRPCARIAPDLAGAALRRPPRTPGFPASILFIGGVWADKGGPRLLRWHQERWADRAALHVVSGEVSATDYPGARNVRFHGRVDHDTLLRTLIPQADVLAVPTRWDTFLIAAQEAQAQGVPVITSRTGGVPECVSDGKTGYLCDPTSDRGFIEAIDRLLGDEALRRQMGQAAAAHAKRNLNADLWHEHLLSQIIALVDGRPLAFSPPEVD